MAGLLYASLWGFKGACNIFGGSLLHLLLLIGCCVLDLVTKSFRKVGALARPREDVTRPLAFFSWLLCIKWDHRLVDDVAVADFCVGRIVVSFRDDVLCFALCFLLVPSSIASSMTVVAVGGGCTAADCTSGRFRGLFMMMIETNLICNTSSGILSFGQQFHFFIEVSFYRIYRMYVNVRIARTKSIMARNNWR